MCPGLIPWVVQDSVRGIDLFQIVGETENPLCNAAKRLHFTFNGQEQDPKWTCAYEGGWSKGTATLKINVKILQGSLEGAAIVWKELAPDDELMVALKAKDYAKRLWFPTNNSASSSAAPAAGTYD